MGPSPDQEPPGGQWPGLPALGTRGRDWLPRGDGAPSPADDALHLDVLVLLLPPQPLLALLQPRLVLQHQLLRRLLLALEQGLVLLQLLVGDA